MMCLTRACTNVIMQLRCRDDTLTPLVFRIERSECIRQSDCRAPRKLADTGGTPNPCSPIHLLALMGMNPDIPIERNHHLDGFHGSFHFSFPTKHQQLFGIRRGLHVLGAAWLAMSQPCYFIGTKSWQRHFLIGLGHVLVRLTHLPVEPQRLTIQARDLPKEKRPKESDSSRSRET